MLKIRFFLICCCLLVVCMIIAFVYLNASREYIFGQEDGVYFGMTASSLIRKKGTPLRSDVGAYDTPQEEYTYKETILNYEATCSYSFIDNRLVEVYISLVNVEEDAAMAVMQTIILMQQETYSNMKGYYCEKGDVSPNGQFCFSHGINTGYSGVVFDITYNSGEILIYGVKQ